MRGLILVAALAARSASAEEAIAFSVQAGAGSRGDERVELSARAQLGDGALLFGVETTQGQRSPERTGLVAGAEVSLEPIALHAEVRAVPPSVELSRFALEAGARLEGKEGAGGLALLLRKERLRDSELQSAGLALEGEWAAASQFRLGLRGAAWATQLTGPAVLDEAWSTFGDETLAWTERWEAQVWSRISLGPLALTPALALAQPAQSGQWAARAALQVEASVGPLVVSVEGSAAREWPRELLLGGLTLGLSWQIGGER